MVTGASGFVGQALCRTLIEKGYNVTGTFRSKEKYSEFKEMMNCVVIEEIGPKTDWARVLAGIDVVVHLASRVHKNEKKCISFANEYHEINTKGTEVLAEASVRSGVRKLIYLSTIKVNGEGTEAGGQKSEIRDQEAELKGAYSEEDIPEPRDPYGTSKWEAEKVLNKISEETGMEIVILRSPLIYGPRVRANFLLLLKVIDCGIPLPLARVNNRRSLIYLKNLVDVIVTCIKNSRASSQTYFVSDGEDVSTPELIRRISSALGRPARLFPLPPVMLKMAGIITGKSVTMDRLVRSLTIDCSKIRRELEWQAPFSMDQGLRETAKWYQTKD